MSGRRFSLAQANVARMRAPLEDPLMDGFRSQLERINELADRSPGFNMSVWESLEALHAYGCKSDHVRPLRARRDGLHAMEGPRLVLWWIPAGHTPAVEEARAVLELLQQRGPSRKAFTFRSPEFCSSAAS